MQPQAARNHPLPELSHQDRRDEDKAKHIADECGLHRRHVGAQMPHDARDPHEQQAGQDHPADPAQVGGGAPRGGGAGGMGRGRRRHDRGSRQRDCRRSCPKPGRLASAACPSSKAAERGRSMGQLTGERLFDLAGEFFHAHGLGLIVVGASL